MVKNFSKDFVTFTRPGSRLVNSFVRLTERGGFLFSSGCVHAERLTQYSHCVLAYNSMARKILLTFVKSKEVDEAIKLTHRAEKNSSLQSSSFFRFFKLDPKILEGRYHLEKIPRKETIYIISLNEKVLN